MKKRRIGSSRRATTPTAATSAAFDLVQARANWQAACETYDAVSQGYVALCSEMESAARATATEHSKRLAAVYEGEAKLAGAMDKQEEAASALLAAPASIEALPYKLAVFRRLWNKEHGVDQPLDGGDVADVAAGIVLDLLTLLRGGAAAELARAA